MAQAVYHYIENYSNVGKIGIAYNAINALSCVHTRAFAPTFCHSTRTCPHRLTLYLLLEIKKNVSAFRCPLTIARGAECAQTPALPSKKRW